MNNYYPIKFINQYVKVPPPIVNQVIERYPDEGDGVRHCLGLIVMHLHAFGEVAYSSSKEFFTENCTAYFTFENLMAALRIAERDGFADLLGTAWQRGSSQGADSSAMRAGPRLDEFGYFETTRPIELDIKSLPLLSINKKQVFSSKDLTEVKSQLMTGDVEARVLANRLQEVYDEVLSLNRDYWNKLQLDTTDIESDCIDRVGLTRIFKNGLVGRWYQKGPMSYQQLTKEERIKLSIDGEEVREIEYSAMHPHLLYSWENEQCPPSFYEQIMAKCGCALFIVQKLMHMAILAKDYSSLIAGIELNEKEEIAANRYRSTPTLILNDELKKQNLSPKWVIDAIASEHPVMKKYLYSAKADRLLLTESEIITSVLLALKSTGIPALPVHDSVIVPKHSAEITKGLMRQIYQTATGFIPTVN